MKKAILIAALCISIALVMLYVFALFSNVSKIIEQQAEENINHSFSAAMGNTTVFTAKDITHVCTTAKCSGISYREGCSQNDTGWTCKYLFSITISKNASEMQAAATRNLSVIKNGSDQYLSEKMYFYFDGEQISSLDIGADLKGQAVTEIQISGQGAAKPTREEAIDSALQRMRTIQIYILSLNKQH